MGDGTGALWFGAAGFEVLAVHADGWELTIEVETAATVVGCAGCGTRARPKDRRWVTVRDAPAGDRPVLVRWRKRIWLCPEAACDVRTWTETSELVAPRRVLTARAAAWATNRVAATEGTPASIARGFGVSWSTVWTAVRRLGTERIDEPVRVGPTEMVGFDETVMQPAERRRRRRFVTAVVDVGTGQILDVFEGRDAKDLQAWMAAMDPMWLAQIDVVSVDPHEGYRSAVTGAASPLAGVTVVVDPFHIVRLANMAVTRCRQRVQQETLEHRGWKGDPLYDVRKLLLLAPNASTSGPGPASGRPCPPGTPTTPSPTPGPRRRRSATSTSPRTPSRRQVVSTTPSPGAAQPSPGPSCGAWPRRCAAGAPRSSPTTTPARPTGPSRPPTSSSSRSNAPDEGSATSTTTGSASSSPAAATHRAKLTPSRASDPAVPGWSRRAFKVRRVAGPRTMLNVSSPNLVAVDLVTRPKLAGGLSNVATLLAELPDLDGGHLATLVARRSRSDARRLGWLLELVREDLDLDRVRALAEPDVGQPTPLRADGSRQGEREPRWGLLINTTVEPDEL